ncbi:hypothetical protein DFH11DRAFT_1685360 [Phellopilus nigrolimitatus]|nr:hypothetical protein DFH11DRAFT_1685360 [Phellopilus nigrolimitatus]
MSEPTTNPLADLPLDPGLYAPSPEDVAFFKSQTGIEDDEELKQHVIAVQKEAWKVVQYQCIRAFSFTRLGITHLPAYKDLLKMGKERPGAIFIDFACCFGSDARKAIADGYPMENVVTADLEQVFWDLGNKLFRTTPETFPVPFVQCDALDPAHIAPRAPFYAPPDTPRPDLKALTTLTSLQGHVSAIHVSLFFHLFDEATQLRAARALASLLAPAPGSMLFGRHSTQPVPGLRDFANSRGVRVFCHSPESWCALWDGVVFEKGTVEVQAELREIERKDIKEMLNEGTKVYIMVWSVKRL